MMHGATQSSRPRGLGAILAVLVGILATWGPAEAATTGIQAHFGTPEAAVEALLTALKTSDDGALSALFGAGYADRLLSKDQVAARESRGRLYEVARKALILRKETADRVSLLIGPDAWPFPIPSCAAGPTGGSTPPRAWRRSSTGGSGPTS